MCVMCKLEAGAEFDPQFIWVYAKENPHGFGFMWPEKGRVKTYNSMADADKAKEYFQKFLDAKVDFAFHCRLASVGAKNLQNTHPVKILSIDDGDPKDVYMMHNGTFSGVGGEKDMSDTYNLATYYLAPLFKKYPDIYLNEDFTDLLDTLIVSSKLILLDSDSNWVIINECLGQFYGEEDKVWISNKNKPSTTYVEKTTYNSWQQSQHFPASGAASPAKQIPATAGSTTNPHAAHDSKKPDGNDGAKGYWKLEEDGRSFFERIQVGESEDGAWSEREFDEILAEVKELRSEDEFYKFCVENPYEAVDCMHSLARTDPSEFHETIRKNKTQLLLWTMSEPINFAEHLATMVMFSEE